MSHFSIFSFEVLKLFNDFFILVCPSVDTLVNNKALRERIYGVDLPQIVNYMVKSEGYGKLFECAKILCTCVQYIHVLYHLKVTDRLFPELTLAAIKGIKITVKRKNVKRINVKNMSSSKHV